MTDKPPKNPNRMVIECPCGEELTLDRVGGQYQNEYRKKCRCGREWVLTEISELLAEIDDCRNVCKARLQSIVDYKIKRPYSYNA